ncbi:MAG: chemotaxis protein CheW, partial [Pseudomonadota bacterium]
LSIIAGLTVGVSEQRFAIPQSYVEEIVHSSAKALDYAQMGETALVTFRGARTPCLMLSDVLGLPASNARHGDHIMVMLRLASGDLFALAVDTIHNHGDLVVKPLAPAIMKTGLYAGTTLMDDGQPVMLLDVTSIASQHGLVSDARTHVLDDDDKGTSESSAHVVQAMLFSDLNGRRSAIRLELLQRIETAPAAAIEKTGSSARVVIDGNILPLIGLPAGALPSERIRCLRLTDGACELLYAVREVDDAVELTQDLKLVSDDPEVEAVTLVEGKAVTLLDGHALFSLHGEAPQSSAKPTCVIPDTEWARTILAPLIQIAGYSVATEHTEAEEITITFDVLASGERPSAEDAAVIRLRDQPEDECGANTIYRYDREGLLSALRDATQRRSA